MVNSPFNKFQIIKQDWKKSMFKVSMVFVIGGIYTLFVIWLVLEYLFKN
jgi:hypothetical protein